MQKTDRILEQVAPLILARASRTPWVVTNSDGRQFSPDFPLLEQLLAVPIGEGSGSETGRLAKVINATALVLAEWKNGPEFRGVRLRSQEVPSDLNASVFFGELVGRVLERTPIDAHVRVRELRDQRKIQLQDIEFVVNESAEDE